MKYFGYLAIAFITTSCFVFQDTERIQQTEQENQYALKTKRAQDSVSNYIKRFALPSETYFAYDFSELYEIKPKEILEYEELVKQRSRLPLLENRYHGQLPNREKELDSLIEDKKNFIRDNKIHSTLELGHIFSLKTPDSSIVSEKIFYLFPNFIVKDFRVNYYLKLSRIETQAYERFLFRRPLFVSGSIEKDEKLDEQFYNNLHTELAKREDKNTFLKHIITLVNLIHQKGNLDFDFAIRDLSQIHFNYYTKNENVSIIDVEMLMSPTEGKATDSNFSYQYKVNTSEGAFIVSFNNFLEIVETLKL
jgi:hypothetical protein